MREESSRHCVVRIGALLLGLLFVLNGPRAEAYPIAPMTLWELTLEAELIVWAEVEAVTTRTFEDYDAYKLSGFEEGVARLRVLEVWKGTAHPDERVEVAYSPSMNCPAPPRYVQGLPVVAFLTRWNGTWSTVGLSYGTRYPTSNDEAQAYRRLVELAVKAQAEASPSVPYREDEQALASAPMDWEVLAASHPATRWDGLFRLVPSGDVVRDFYVSGVDRSVRLSPAQRETLARGFVAQPPLDRSLPMLLLPLRGHASAEVDVAAARALETVLMVSGPTRWALLAFDLLRERHGERLVARVIPDEEVVRRAWASAQQGGVGAGSKDVLSLQEEWRRFKQRRRMTPKLLPLPVEPTVAGVGGETPL
ncbi:hypothetical protein LXT21_24550 [Myxococcus sp. K38C18041901]|uniref:hypothetical protein n=1 Tax=Myxococcus guangdongensis TaxID=2906760 RepID=UPI0020A71B0A|nr:hypothetical protein [Myxococcus guangdongensis]MCP3061958.1 hypothetical protein [Myxococcus guangdongensis]